MTNTTRSTTEIMANPRQTCHICSSFADTIDPKADRISKRAALPLVSFFCSTTRVPLRSPRPPTPRSGEAFFPALSTRQLSAQVDNLPNVMICVPRASHENLQATFGFRLALCGVPLAPVSLPLLLNRVYYHGDGLIKCLERRLLVWWIGIAELTVPVPAVPRFRDASPDVIAQSAGQMQHQVPHAVSVRIWFAPELVVGQRVHPLVQMFGDKFVIRRQSICNGFIERRHATPPRANRFLIVTETISRPEEKSSTRLPPCAVSAVGVGPGETVRTIASVTAK